jgi:glutamate transport system substrate-binding protein
MRQSRIIAGLGLAAAALLTLTACNSGTPGAAPTGDASGSADEGTWFTVADDVKLEGSPTYDAIKERGSVNVGVKEDQPGLGYLDPTTGERTGFDVDVARWIAASLGYDEDKITFTAIPSANREQAIINGDVDYYVGTYSITDSRKERVSFAGPYFIAGQDLLVRKDDTSITGPDSLKGKTTCSVTGSTSLKRIKEEYGGDTVELEKYSLCVDQLLDKQVDAVTTDDAILKGYAAQDPDHLMVDGKPFSQERYGVGIPKGDVAMCESINSLLETARSNGAWMQIYNDTLGKSGAAATQPETDPCS